MHFKQFLLIILFPLLSTQSPHPIYISNTEIDFKPEKQTLEIAIKIFSDDLQEAISKKKQKTIEIGTEREDSNATSYIIEYLQENFKLEINGKNLPFEYVNRDVIKKDFYAMWVLVKVSKIKKIKTFKLYNNILIDEQDQQQNIINFREDVNGTYRKFLTHKGVTTVQLK